MKVWVKAVSLLAAACAVIALALLAPFGKAEAPQQPIEFDHWQHVKSEEGPQLDCGFCHEHADKSPAATIPNTSTCMICHETMKTDSPEVQKLAALHGGGRQPEWRRVYWFEPSANAYFTHKPHVRAGLDCSACHGQVGEMRRVRREVNQTMGWCVECHRQSRVSVDCYVCHR